MRLFRWLPLAGAAWLIAACSAESAAPGSGQGGSTQQGGSGVMTGATSAGGSSSMTGAGTSSGGSFISTGGSAAGMAGSTSAQAGQSSAGSGGNPNGGNSASGGTGGGNALPPFGPAPVDKPDTDEVGVRNNCPFPIWIHGQGKQGALMPDYKELQKGDFYWYDAPKQWEAARITAYGDAAHTDELDKVEMTFVQAGDVLNYNVTYVDWLSLPMEMISRGTGDCKQVGCYVPEATILAGCPDGLLSGKRCQAARTYCLGGKNADKPYCHALDSQVQACTAIAGCEGAAGNTTANAYACDSFFGGSPKWCAAVNRGMLDDPDNKDTTKYYQKAPFNTYSQWVHQVCPGIYAFAYDDYPPNAEESGFHACNGGKELEVTFCPAG
jgi:hypothetical protein